MIDGALFITDTDNDEVRVRYKVMAFTGHIKMFYKETGSRSMH